MKNYFLHILFSCIALFTSAQKPLVLLEIEPKEAEVGEMLTIIVKSNVQGEVDIDLPIGFVHGYDITSFQKQEIDYNTGKVVSYYFLSQTGAMSKSGTFKIGPAYVKKGSKVYRSNTVNITIKKENVTVDNDDNFTSKQLRQPAFGVIEKSKSEIYEGEPLVLNAKVYSQFSPSHLEDYQAYTMDGVLDKHDIGNTTRIVVEEERIKRTNYYTFEYDKKVIFPVGTGKMTIDPFKLILRRGMEGMPITSSATTIEVKPLPSNVPKNFIGAVGQFSIARSIQNGKFKQGDVFTMTLEISGSGNLQNILEPKLNLPKGFVVYGDPIVKEDFVFGSRGAEGKISYEYNIQVTTFGTLTFPETELAYFDPEKEKYISISTKSNVLIFEKNDKFKTNPDDQNTLVEQAKSDQIFAMRRDEGNKYKENRIYTTPIFWIGVSSPLLLAFILGIWWKKKEEHLILGEQKLATRQTQSDIKQLFNEAETALKQGDLANYYSLIEKGIHRSMAHYLKQDDSVVLSKSELFQSLEDRNINPGTINALRLLLSTCEHGRYGLGIGSEERDNLVISAKQIVQTICNS